MSADVLGQPALPAVQLTRAAKEALLSNGSLVGGPVSPPSATFSRVTLDDGTTTHRATIQAANGTDAVLNVAAYELDKILDLDYVAPAVVRVVNGQPAVVIWWVDDMLMDEVSRRKNKTEPPDLDRWNKQSEIVRVFDELAANAYRDTSPDKYLSTLWDNLLITRDWTIWLIDHKRTFQARPTLAHPDGLTVCDRSLLRRLKGLNLGVLTTQLGSYLSSEQLGALESRRELLVKHFDRLIASRGESVVLYDRPPRP